MNIWRSIAGMLDMELTSAEQEKTLAAINEAGIILYRLRQVSELTCAFYSARQDYSRLEKICQKRGDSLKVVEKRGIFWWIDGIRKRPLLLSGIVLWCCLVFFLPTRVLFVGVDGNVKIPTARILDAAEACGIEFGASRREVRSEKVKNSLLSAVPELQWAGVNTSGCLAVISVRERSIVEEKTEERTVSNIVASRDGYILSGEVTQGNGLFQIGQTVKQGQILISGYTDCGICIRTTRSQGEIFAETNREITAITPLSCLRRREYKDTKRKISLLFRKKRINLWKDSGISDATCGRMYEEYYITLPGGFRLPIALCLETYSNHDTEPAVLSQADVEDGLSRFADRYLLSQMIAGKLLQKDLRLTAQDGAVKLQGDVICTEMIGREQRGQIGDTNGKNS